MRVNRKKNWKTLQWDMSRTAGRMDNPSARDRAKTTPLGSAWAALASTAVASHIKKKGRHSKEGHICSNQPRDRHHKKKVQRLFHGATSVCHGKIPYVLLVIEKRKISQWHG